MQTQPTPISQIVSPNATPGPANRSLPPAADGDFQRALDRQIEQRQLSSKAAQAQAPAAAQPQQQAQPQQAPAQAPQAATPQNQPANKTQTSEAAPEDQAAPADAAQAANPASTPASSAKDGSEPEQAASVANTAVTAVQAAPEDPAAAMLALVSSIKLAMQQPAANSKTAAEAPATSLTAKGDGKAVTAAQLLASGKVSADAGKGVSTTVSKGTAPAGDFADSLEQAQGKAQPLQGASLPAGKADAGKLAIDLQVAATAKNATPLAEPLLKEAPTDISKLAAQLQPAALQQAAAAAAVPADKLAGRVGTPAWDQQLGQKVVWMAAGGDQSATLTLNPPDLGPLKVVLSVTNDQANAAFMSAQPEVRQALEAAMPRLREMMSEAGIAFGNATVSAGTQEQQNQGNRDMASDSRRGSHGNSGSKVTGGEIAIAAATGSQGRASLSAVDTFA